MIKKKTEIDGDINYERKKAGPLDIWNSICHFGELSMEEDLFKYKKGGSRGLQWWLKTETSIWSVPMDNHYTTKQFHGS